VLAAFAKMSEFVSSRIDSQTLLGSLALLISGLSLAVSWRSGKRAARALEISEAQEERKQPQLRIYLARGYRRYADTRQLFGFLVSVSNPTDSGNSIARAELQLTYVLRNDVRATCRIPHQAALANRDEESVRGQEVFALPTRIDPHQTVIGWFLFSLDDDLIGEGTIDAHKIVLEDSHDIETDSGAIMVREWTHEA
jgi:hypothetical protein